MVVSLKLIVSCKNFGNLDQTNVHDFVRR